MSSPAPASQLPQAAGFWRRLAAMGYDTLLVVPLAMAVTATSIGIKVGLVGADNIRQSHAAALGSEDPLYWINLLLALLAVAGFFIGFWVRAGRTLGMQAWRLRVEQPDGRNITLRQALARLAGALVSLACLGLGYLWVLKGPAHATWHDRWSGTRVVLLPKAAKASRNPGQP